MRHNLYTNHSSPDLHLRLAAAHKCHAAYTLAIQSHNHYLHNCTGDFVRKTNVGHFTYLFEQMTNVLFLVRIIMLYPKNMERLIKTYNLVLFPVGEAGTDLPPNKQHHNAVKKQTKASDQFPQNPDVG